MERAFKVSLRSDGVAVIVDYSSLHKFLGLKDLRIDDVVETLVSKLIDSCLKRYQVIKHQGALYMELLCKGATKHDYGIIERCVDEYERSIKSKFSSRRHVFFTFFSDKPLLDVDFAVYSITTHVASSYEVLGRLCRLISKEYGYLAERLGRDKVVFPVSGVEELPEKMRFNVAGLDLELTLHGIKPLNFSSAYEANRIKRLLHRAIKIKLKSKGFIVKGLQAYWSNPVVESDKIEVRRGFEFNVIVFSDGVVALALSPKSEVSSKLTLWEESGKSYESLLKMSRELHGRAAKRLYDGAIIRILRVEPIRVHEIVSGASVLSIYGTRGILSGQISVEEPVVVGDLKGEEVREAPSMLKLIYTLKDLKRMKVTSEVVKFLHSPPQLWLKSAKDFLKSIGHIELGRETIGFIDEPPEVELL